MIEVIKADLAQVLKRYRHRDGGTAFAHCISLDLDNPQHMSAGVAVTFGEEFGRSQQSDCISEYLSY